MQQCKAQMLNTYEYIKRNDTANNKFKTPDIATHDLLLKFHKMLQNSIYPCRCISKYRKNNNSKKQKKIRKVQKFFGSDLISIISFFECGVVSIKNMTRKVTISYKKVIHNIYWRNKRQLTQILP